MSTETTLFRVKPSVPWEKPDAAYIVTPLSDGFKLFNWKRVIVPIRKTRVGAAELAYRGEMLKSALGPYFAKIEHAFSCNDGDTSVFVVSHYPTPGNRSPSE